MQTGCHFRHEYKAVGAFSTRQLLSPLLPFLCATPHFIHSYSITAIPYFRHVPGLRSYQDQTTFGFFVDVGNGFTTLLPTLLWAVAMTWPVIGMPARALGSMGLIKFYQEVSHCDK